MSLSMHLFNTQHTGVMSNEGIGALINMLNNEDGQVRRQARLALVYRGFDAVPDLIRALSYPDRDVRWEAAKALGEIGDPSSAPALVEALEDERFGVRWLAAEGLIGMGNAALPALMAALARSADSVWQRGGAHHVLRGIAARARARQETLPQEVWAVLAALEDVEPSVETPPVACRAWQSLTGRSQLPDRYELPNR
jgi:hypothetical protein